MLEAVLASHINLVAQGPANSLLNRSTATACDLALNSTTATLTSGVLDRRF